MNANTRPRRTVLVVLGALVLAFLAWAVISTTARLNPTTSPGPLLKGQPATHRCISGNGSTSFAALHEFYDIPDATAFLEYAQATKTTNLRDVKTFVNHQAPVGGALPEQQLFVSGNFVTIEVTGTVVNPTKAARVQGLTIRYALADGPNLKHTQYAGTLPWTAIQSPTTCP